MNTRIQSMLWIWIIWSVLCAGVSVVIFGLNQYAKSHTWRADFTYLASAQNSPPPPYWASVPPQAIFSRSIVID